MLLKESQNTRRGSQSSEEEASRQNAWHSEYNSPSWTAATCKKLMGSPPQTKRCEILLDGLKSVFRDPKARLLQHLKGCGANQDDFGLITFRLD